MMRPRCWWILATLLTMVIIGGGSGWAKSLRSPDGVHLTVFEEPHQKAFTILIPKGWKTEGGMIPSGVEWNLVDLVETNISFRVTSPDGQSFFGCYPRFYFQDPQVLAQSSYGMMQMQPGQVMNGCWLYPFLDVAQYVQHIVFAQFAADGKGNYFLRDHDDGTLPFDNAAEWRKLKIVNRNAPEYRPE